MDKDKLKETLIQIRRELHENAEVGFNLHNTLRIIREALSRHEIECKRLGRAGLVADIGKGEVRVLLRADTDALSIREKSGLSFSAKNGNMHACGHDLHTVMLIGSALLLKEDNLPYAVRLVFQPAEEELSGASDMISAGLLRDISPEYAFAIHVGVGKTLPVGTVVLPPTGDAAPSAAYFKISFAGESTHGARPEDGKDAVLAICDERIRLSGIIGKYLKDGYPRLTVGKIRGGESAGVIGDYSELSGSFRAFDSETFEALFDEIKVSVEAVGKIYSVNGTLEITGQAPSLRIDKGALSYAKKALSGILSDDAIITPPNMGGGSEDFAHISRHVPSAMLVVGAGDGGGHTLHNPSVIFDEECILLGARLYAVLGRSLAEGEE